MPSQSALRIVLSHKGKSFRVESVTRVRKVVQPSDSLGEAQGEAESWVAIQGSHGKPVFRRLIQNPLGTREAPTGEKRELRQVRLPEPSGVVTFLLPDLPEAQKVVLYASGADDEEGPRSAEPVFEVTVKRLSALAREGGSRREHQ